TICFTSSSRVHQAYENDQSRLNRIKLIYKVMANNLIILLFLLCNLTAALADSNVSCYRIEPGTIAGIISADLLLTLIIVVVTYRCASLRREKIDKADKVYMNVRANVQNSK
ncbi:hypothetical protein AMECASPLE_023567, partial [Ameca splendens]